jgi:hypothetical protein
MATGNSRGVRSNQTSPQQRLVLELIITEPQPLTGQVGPAGTPDRIPFRGWIDLMSAINTLCDNGTGTLRS